MAASKPKPIPKPTARGAKPKPSIAPRPILQWITAGLGLAVTLGAGGVILAEALQPARPVDLAARFESERRTSTSRVVNVVVANAGSETAAGVEVVGKIGSETASATLDYVPGDGEASVSLVFPLETTGHPVELSVSGWSKP